MLSFQKKNKTIRTIADNGMITIFSRPRKTNEQYMLASKYIYICTSLFSFIRNITWNSIPQIEFP